MRLIDADICIEKIKNLSIEYDAETVQRCIEVLSNAPTIDTPTVRHGKWIEKSTGGTPFYCCSRCGRVEWEMPHNYCPNCGARMDERKEE